MNDLKSSINQINDLIFFSNTEKPTSNLTLFKHFYSQSTKQIQAIYKSPVDTLELDKSMNEAKQAYENWKKMQTRIVAHFKKNLPKD
ncbi:MAG: hypothetical protein H0W88_01785 [Parachlamydiaceae bacterium]|nr:hypothetical protein [Parachlamydiaceae bacterium]